MGFVVNNGGSLLKSAPFSIVYRKESYETESETKQKKKKKKKKRVLVDYLLEFLLKFNY